MAHRKKPRGAQLTVVMIPLKDSPRDVPTKCEHSLVYSIIEWYNERLVEYGPFVSGPVAMQSGLGVESPQVPGRPGNRGSAPMCRTRQVGDVRSMVFQFASNPAMAGSFFQRG